MAETATWECPNCGSTLLYEENRASQHVRCPFCDQHVKCPSLYAYDPPLVDSSPPRKPDSDTKPSNWTMIGLAASGAFALGVVVAVMLFIASDDSKRFVPEEDQGSDLYIEAVDLLNNGRRSDWERAPSRMQTLSCFIFSREASPTFSNDEHAEMAVKYKAAVNEFYGEMDSDDDVLYILAIAHVIDAPIWIKEIRR